MPPRKKPFKEKFEKVGNEWKPKGPGGGWQTPKAVDIPSEAEPWLLNLRMWVCEMNQWAEVVNEEIHQLRGEVESLKAHVEAVPAQDPVPTGR
jgi:hypothetical protein